VAKKPPYVREYKDRHGVLHVEYRRKGQKGWQLRQPLRSPEFWEDYEAAVMDRVQADIDETEVSNLSSVERQVRQ
jgi:hypothetical protein